MIKLFAKRNLPPVWLVFLFILIEQDFVYAQVNCGNISVSVTTVPTTRILAYNGSYTITLTGGPGTYSVATNDGSTEDQDDILCLLYGGDYCGPQTVYHYHTIVLTPDHPSESITVSELSGGSYPFKVRNDSLGCNLRDTAIINYPSCIVKASVSHTDVTIPGAQDGTITVSSSMGRGDVKIELKKSDGFIPTPIANSTNMATFTGLQIGDYIIEASDSTDCYFDTIISVNGSFCNLQIVPSNISAPSWGGGSDGAVTIEVTGNGNFKKVQTYDFISESPFYDSPHTFDDLTPGRYNFFAKNEDGCTATLAGVVMIPANTSCNLSVHAYGTTENAGRLLHIDILNSPATDFLAIVKNSEGVTVDSAFLGQGNRIGGWAFIIQHPGTYHVYVAEALLDGYFGGYTTYCEYTTDVTFSVDCSTFQGIATGMDVSTYGVKNGKINVNSTGGNGQVKIVLNGNCLPQIFDLNNQPGNKSGLRSKLSMDLDTIIDQGSFTALAPGNHHICYYDEAGCSTIQYVTIGSVQCTLNTTVTPTQPTANLSNGTIAVTAHVAGSTEAVRIFIARQNYGTILDGFNSITAYNLPEGTYEITSYGVNSQYCSKTETVILDDGLNCDIQINVTGTTDVTAYGASDGTISAEATGSHGPVTLSLGSQSFKNSGTFNGLPPGGYNVHAIDTAGCTASTGGYFIQTPRCGLKIAVGTVLPTPGHFDGTITVTTSGVMDTVYVAITVPSIIGFITVASGINGVTAHNLASDYYNIQAYTKDYQNCSAGASVFLPTTCELHPFAFPSNASGPFNSDGQVVVGANGGTGYYNISGPGNKIYGNTFTGLGPGTYTYTIQDLAAGCSATIDATVSSPGCFVLGGTKQDVSIYGGTDGSIYAYFTDGTSSGNVTYRLKKNGTLITTLVNNSNFTGLSAGTYTITANDEVGCISSADYIITQPQCVFDTTAVIHQPAVHGGQDASLTFSATGGLGIVNIKLLTVTNIQVAGPLPSPATFNHLSPGIYHVQAYDEATCQQSYTITIGQPACNVLTIVNHKNVSIHGGNDGRINVYAYHGVPPFSIYLNRSNIILNSKSTNDSTFFDGLTSGTYVINSLDQSSCYRLDTVVITEPNCNPTSSSFTVTSCESYNWMGTVYTQSGIYTKVVTNATGCDSTITLHLIIKHASQSSISATACNSYNFFGQILTQSGLYTHALLNTAGCDSIISLSLTINRNSHADIAASACNSYSWFGQVYSQSGVYTHTIPNATGCDSTITLTLTINHSSHAEISATACNSYSWFGQLITQSGIFTHIIPNAAGCDSTITLTLSIKHDSHAEASASACNSYSWNGQLYTQSGVYTDTITNESGCDSIITLTLTINHSVSSSSSMTTCGMFTYLGVTYSNPGDYTIASIFPSANGCDSAVIFNLHILPPMIQEENVTTCNSYTWYGKAYSQSGDYRDTVHLTSGCDSIHVLHLTIHPPTTSYTSISSCQSYAWNGQVYTQSGTYMFHTQNSNGCDSTATLILTIDTPVLYYLDADHDGHAVSAILACNAPNPNYTSTLLPIDDCNDNNSGIHPGALDNNCNGVDENCDGVADEGFIAGNCTSCQNGVIVSTKPTAPVITITQPTCILSTGMITVTNPTTGVTYSFDNGLNFQASRIKSGLVPGTYKIRIKSNSTSCISDSTVAIINAGAPTIPAPTASTTKQPTCIIPTGTITISNPTSGHTYSFNNGVSFQSARVMDSLAPGTYLIKVKSNSTGCISEATAVTVNPVPATGPPAPAVSTTKQPTCSITTGTITVSNPTSGHSYSFDNGLSFQSARVMDSLAPGTYLVRVKSIATGCISEATSVVVDPVPTIGPPAPTASTTKQPTCSIPMGTITVSIPTSGYTYSFNNGASFQNSRVKDSLVPGTYLVKVKSNATGCISDATQVVVDPVPTSGPPAPTASTTKQPTCSILTGTITVSSPTSGFTYSFNNGASFQNSRVMDSLVPGTYLVKVKSNATGCISDATQVVVDPVPTSGPPAPTASTSKQPTCSILTGTITVSSPTSGFTYSFNNGASFQNSRVMDSLVPGTYLVKVKSNATGCISDATQVVVDPVPTSGPPAPTASATKQPTCSILTGTITVSSPTSGYTYSFNNGASFQNSRVMDSLVPGTYLVKVKSNATGCVSDATPVIVDPIPTNGPPAPVVSVTKQPTCPSPTGTITVTNPTSGYTYSFDGGLSFQTNRVKSGLSSGSYMVLVKSNATGCISTGVSITINELPLAPSPPEASITTPPTCSNQTATITVNVPTSGYTYSFDNGLTFQSSRVKGNIPVGKTLLKVKSNATGCISEADSINVIAAVCGSALTLSKPEWIQAPKIKAIAGRVEMSIYPNPANEILSFRFDHELPPSDQYKVVIMDQLGKILYNQFYDNNALQSLKLRIGFLQSGNYIVRVFSDNDGFPTRLLTVMH